MIGDVDLVQKGQVTRLEEAAPDRLPRALVRANSDEELIRLWLDAVGAPLKTPWLRTRQKHCAFWHG